MLGVSDSHRSNGSLECTQQGKTCVKTCLGLAALAAIAIGILSVLAHENVLSNAWEIIESKTWSHITWASGVFVLGILGLCATDRPCISHSSSSRFVGGGSGAGGIGGRGGSATVDPNPANTQPPDTI